MRQPRNTRPSSIWVINVFSIDRRKPIPDKTSAISSRKASASARVPNTDRHQSSAYADCRVMPTWAVLLLVRPVSGVVHAA